MAAINPAENPSVLERRDENKQKLLEALKEMPVVTVACKRAAVSPATYYRWRQEDKEFKRQSRGAMDLGIEFVNDMSETQLITLIKEKKMPAIALWLKHHHPRYGSRAEPYVPLAAREDLTIEEEQIVIEALALASGKPVRRNNHVHADRTNHAGGS